MDKKEIEDFQLSGLSFLSKEDGKIKEVIGGYGKCKKNINPNSLIDWLERAKLSKRKRWENITDGIEWEREKGTEFLNIDEKTYKLKNLTKSDRRKTYYYNYRDERTKIIRKVIRKNTELALKEGLNLEEIWLEDFAEILTSIIYDKLRNLDYEYGIIHE